MMRAVRPLALGTSIRCAGTSMRRKKACRRTGVRSEIEHGAEAAVPGDAGRGGPGGAAGGGAVLSSDAVRDAGGEAIPGEARAGVGGACGALPAWVQRPNVRAGAAGQEPSRRRGACLTVTVAAMFRVMSGQSAQPNPTGSRSIGGNKILSSEFLLLRDEGPTVAWRHPMDSQTVADSDEMGRGLQGGNPLLYRAGSKLLIVAPSKAPVLTVYEIDAPQ
jgi:hypothetical protein